MFYKLRKQKFFLQKKSEEKMMDSLARIEVIWPSDIGDCPIKFVLREFLVAKKESVFPFQLGRLVHKLFRLIAIKKNLNLPTANSWKDIISDETFFDELSEKKKQIFWKIFPTYEPRIEKFFNISPGKYMVGIPIHKEIPVEAPVSTLNLNLPLSPLVLGYYKVRGRVDFMAFMYLFEVKSGSKIRKEDFIQATIYQQAWKAMKNPRVNYFVVYLGKGGPRKLSNCPGVPKAQLITELTGQLTELILNREKLKVEPLYLYPEWKPRLTECNSCPYRKACRSKLLRIIHWFKVKKYKIREKLFGRRWYEN